MSQVNDYKTNVDAELIAAILSLDPDDGMDMADVFGTENWELLD